MSKKPIKVFIGVKGKLKTTHCFVSAFPLVPSPVNHDLGNSHYLSCNPGFHISYETLEPLIKKYSASKPSSKKQKKEVTPNDNEH